jgi:arylsulfatase A-like enzyme
MAVLLGKNESGRDELVLEATSRTAFRKGDWAMIPPYNGPARNDLVDIELGNDSVYQLYNLKEDLGQQNNLAESDPEKLQELIDSYRAILKNANTDTKKLQLD